MKLIPLTRDLFAKVDDSDFEYLNQWKWYALKQRNIYYAVRNYPRKNQKRTLIKMHRIILGTENTNIFCDHKDHDGLNNQRSNLRIANCAQNLANKSPHKKSVSKYLGVSLAKISNKYGTKYVYWQAQIQKNYKTTHLGRFKTEEQAAIAYNEAAIKLHGDFANLNKII